MLLMKRAKKSNPAKAVKGKVIDEKPFSEKEVLAVAKAVLARGQTCDHCLGRQTAKVSTGMTNVQRGMILRRLLKAPAFPAKGKCIVCEGIFDALPKYAKDAAGLLSKLEYATFLVGTLPDSGTISREEALWEDVGIGHCESIRSEINRELGKLIYVLTKKEHDPEAPDVTVLLNVGKERIEFEFKPLFVRGKYRKLVRGLPQSKWDKYEETLEDVIAQPLMKATGGSGHSIHASGREDIDARCLGWRPFVLEIKNPTKRTVDLSKMQAAVKKTKKAEIGFLSMATRKDVSEVSTARYDKTYLALVEFEKPVNDKDLQKLSGLVGVIEQRTPTRVAHRRADLVRKRSVLEVSWKKVNNKKIELQIKGEAGLYIKELVSGDGGKSKPSVSGILLNPAVVKELDVMRIWD
jgi:tRNA pseudouridine synthase 10